MLSKIFISSPFLEMGVDPSKERLAKFKAERADKKAKEKAEKRPPFRVGIYKLDGETWSLYLQ